MAGDDGSAWGTGLPEVPGPDGLAEEAAVGAASPVIRLDAHRRPGGRSQGELAMPGGSGTVRVLLVEDEEEDALLVRDLLARAETTRFRVERVADADAGLLRLLGGEHDVCLVDYRLPGRDGLGLARLAARRGVGTPLILYSGLPEPDLDVEAIQAGADDFLDKEQLDVERLERAIRIALARRRRAAHQGWCWEPAAQPSRARFLDRLQGAVARARRQGASGAVLLLAVDAIECLPRRQVPVAIAPVLDRMGERLARCVREADGLARLDAGRFGLVVEGLDRPEHPARVARRLIELLTAPEAPGDAPLAVSAGVARFPEDAEDPMLLEALAEAALGRALAAGGGPCCHHDPAMETTAPDPLELASALRRAIARDALALEFEPQVPLCSPELALAATARWRWRDGRLIEGDGLRALAEAGGSAEPLGDWMIAAACRQVRRWRDGGATAPARVAVPLPSRRPLAWSGLAERLAAHLAAAELGPDRIEVEIEEPLLLAELAGGGETLRAVRAQGVRLAVTAFGAGPMSLGLLRDAPLTTVKLARPLLQGTPGDRRRTELVGNLIRLARQLDLRVVAEGVESHAQLRLLRAQGCDAVQSPAGSPPPTDACAEWLRQAPTGAERWSPPAKADSTSLDRE